MNRTMSFNGCSTVKSRQHTHVQLIDGSLTEIFFFFFFTIVVLFSHLCLQRQLTHACCLYCLLYQCLTSMTRPPFLQLSALYRCDRRKWHLQENAEFSICMHDTVNICSHKRCLVQQCRRFIESWHGCCCIVFSTMTKGMKSTLGPNKFISGSVVIKALTSSQ